MADLLRPNDLLQMASEAELAEMEKERLLKKKKQQEQLAKVAFNVYVDSFNPGSLYTGAVAAVVVIVVWVYYAALIFILGGEVGQVFELRRTRKRQREVFLD